MGNNIIRYMAAMTLANRMLDSATITLKEFLAFEDKMRLKYGLPECSLYRDFHLQTVRKLKVTLVSSYYIWYNM